jgi:hypothetical protein
MKFRSLLVGVSALVFIAGCSSQVYTPDSLKKMAVSANASDRETAMYEMANNYRPEYYQFILQAMIDSDISTRRAALRSVIKTKDRKFLDALRAVVKYPDKTDSDLAAAAIKALEALPQEPTSPAK